MKKLQSTCWTSSENFMEFGQVVFLLTKFFIFVFKLKQNWIGVPTLIELEFPGHIILNNAHFRAFKLYSFFGIGGPKNYRIFNIFISGPGFSTILITMSWVKKYQNDHKYPFWLSALSYFKYKFCNKRLYEQLATFIDNSRNTVNF